jgi:beta-N-acetylhexosaminidase
VGLAAADRDGVGLEAARRAIRVTRALDGPLDRPVVVEVVPPPNIAVGPVPWGLATWVPADSIVRVGTGLPAAELARRMDAALAAASGRSLIVVVRDAHRHLAAREAVTRLLAARPDAVVLEMGLPVWRPPRGAYVATYGAAHTSGLAAAQLLGLA